MAKNFVFPDGTGVAAEMRRAPAFGKVNIGKLIVEAPLRERRNIVAVSLTAIVRSSPFQTRRAFDPENSPKDRAMVESIEALGQHEPVCLKLIGDGQYEIVWGHRRIAALRYLNLTEVLAVIVKCDVQETATWTALENTGEPLSPIEKAELVDLLEKAFGYGADEIAVRLGCTKREVYRFKKILAAHESVRFALQEETITLRLALALATASPEYQPRLVEIAVHNRGAINDSTCNELIQHMAGSLNGPDAAAMAFGLALPISHEPVPIDEPLLECARQVEGEDVDDSAAPIVGLAADIDLSRARDDQVADDNGTHDGGPPVEPARTRVKRFKIPVDQGSVATMLQNEQVTVDRALLGEVISLGTGRGMSVRELRLATLMTHTQPSLQALDDAAVLKSDRSARLVAGISEQLGRLRDLARRGGCSGQTGPMLQALAQEVAALAGEIKGPDKGD